MCSHLQQQKRQTRKAMIMTPPTTAMAMINDWKFTDTHTQSTLVPTPAEVCVCVCVSYPSSVPSVHRWGGRGRAGGGWFWLGTWYTTQSSDTTGTVTNKHRSNLTQIYVDYEWVGVSGLAGIEFTMPRMEGCRERNEGREVCIQFFPQPVWQVWRVELICWFMCNRKHLWPCYSHEQEV